MSRLQLDGMDDPREHMALRSVEESGFTGGEPETVTATIAGKAATREVVFNSGEHGLIWSKTQTVGEQTEWFTATEMFYTAFAMEKLREQGYTIGKTAVLVVCADEMEADDA